MEFLQIHLMLAVTDPAGNEVTDSISVNVDKQDEIPPVISSFLSDITNVILTQNDDSATISFTITATDNFLIDTISIPGASFISQSGNDFFFKKLIIILPLLKPKLLILLLLLLEIHMIMLLMIL